MKSRGELINRRARLGALMVEARMRRDCAKPDTDKWTRLDLEYQASKLAYEAALRDEDEWKPTEGK